MCLNTICPFVSKGITASVVIGSSNISISNQLEAGSIIVRHIGRFLSHLLPFKSVWSYRSTHKVSQGFAMTSNVGRFPYLCLCHFVNVTNTNTTVVLTCDQMVCIIPDQYITVCNVSSTRVCPGC